MPYTLMTRCSETVPMSSFGTRFRALRLHKGLTQDELADVLGITKSAVSAWENDRETPSFQKLVAIRGQLGASLDYLVDDGPELPQVQVGDAAGAYNSEAPCPPGEQTLLRRFRELSEAKQKALLALLK